MKRMRLIVNKKFPRRCWHGKSLRFVRVYSMWARQSPLGCGEDWVSWNVLSEQRKEPVPQTTTVPTLYRQRVPSCKTIFSVQFGLLESRKFDKPIMILWKPVTQSNENNICNSWALCPKIAMPVEKTLSEDESGSSERKMSKCSLCWESSC